MACWEGKKGDLCIAERFTPCDIIYVTVGINSCEYFVLLLSRFFMCVWIRWLIDTNLSL